MNLIINDNEKELMVTLLNRYIKETRVGERHSFSREYKKNLIQVEEIAENIMDKLAGSR